MKTILKTTLIAVFALVTLQLAGQDTKTVVYKCNFDCPSCEAKVMKNLPYEKGVKDVKVIYGENTATVTYKTNKNTEEGIQKALEKLGYEVNIKGEPHFFGVNGNCGMCKEKIEKAALGVNGVTLASWNEDKKQILVTFNAPADINQIQKAIAKVGYDTDKVKAKDEVYNNLHHCCKYDRN